MKRLHVLCEGLTEFNDVKSSTVGRHITYFKLRKQAHTFLRTSDPDFWLTTMIDLYKLPRAFPGISDCDRYTDPLERAEALEESFRRDVGDDRFIPYLQLHEFEVLLLVDLDQLAEYYPNRRRA